MPRPTGTWSLRQLRDLSDQVVVGTVTAAPTAAQSDKFGRLSQASVRVEDRLWGDGLVGDTFTLTQWDWPDEGAVPVPLPVGARYLMFLAPGGSIPHSEYVLSGQFYVVEGNDYVRVGGDSRLPARVSRAEADAEIRAAS